MWKLCALMALSAFAACDPGVVENRQPREPVESHRQPPPSSSTPSPSCKVEDCVVGLEPDLANGTVVESICSCTETDFWNLDSRCSSQGGTVVAAGSCGASTLSCDNSRLNCVVPPPSNPQIVASRCDCGDETQFYNFLNQCSGLGGTVSTAFPSGHEVACTP
jgi:hypothetical protein